MHSQQIFNKFHSTGTGSQIELYNEIWGYICKHVHSFSSLIALSRCHTYLNAQCKVSLLALYNRKAETKSTLECIYEYLPQKFLFGEEILFNLLEAKVLFGFCVLHDKLDSIMIRSITVATVLQKNFLLNLADRLQDRFEQCIRPKAVAIAEELKKHVTKNHLNEHIDTVHEMLRKQNYSNDGLYYLKSLRFAAHSGLIKVYVIIKDILNNRNDLSEAQQLELVELVEQFAIKVPKDAMEIIQLYFSKCPVLTESAKKRLQELAIASIDNKDLEAACVAMQAILELGKYSNETLYYLKSLRIAAHSELFKVYVIIKDILNNRNDLSEAQQLQLVELVEQFAIIMSEKAKELIRLYFSNPALTELAKKRLQDLTIALDHSTQWKK